MGFSVFSLSAGHSHSYRIRDLTLDIEPFRTKHHKHYPRVYTEITPSTTTLSSRSATHCNANHCYHSSPGQTVYMQPVFGAIQASQSLQEAVFADSLGAITGQPTFSADNPDYTTVEGSVYGWNGTTEPYLGYMSYPSSTMPWLLPGQNQPDLLQSVPELASGLNIRPDASISPIDPTVCEHSMQLLPQDSAAAFFPAMDWGQTSSTTGEDQRPAPRLEVFCHVSQNVPQAWLTRSPSIGEQPSRMPCNESNSSAFRYWTEEAYKDSRAMSLARQLAIPIPPGIQHEYQWDPLYSMRRLVLTGEDEAQNLALFFGPTWRQDTQYYHWICRMSLFFPPEIGSRHWKEQSHVDETMSKCRWTPKMPHPFERAVIAEMIGDNGLEHLLQRLGHAHQSTRSYENWPYADTNRAKSVLNSKRDHLGKQPDHLESMSKSVPGEKIP